MSKKLSKKGLPSLLVVAVVGSVIVGAGLAVAFTVLVTGTTDAGRIGLEQSETVNAKLRYDRSKELVDDAAWLGTKEAYLEEDGDPDYDDIREKVKGYMDTLDGMELTQDERNPDYYAGLNITHLEVDSYLENVEVDFPVDVNAWDYTGWGDCGSMNGSLEDVDQFCECMGYEGAAEVAEDPCYQEWEQDRRRWEPDDNADNCIDHWDDDDGDGYAMTKVKCRSQVYKVSYTVHLEGNMQDPRVSIEDEYSSSQILLIEDTGQQDDCLGEGEVTS